MTNNNITNDNNGLMDFHFDDDTIGNDERSCSTTSSGKNDDEAGDERRPKLAMPNNNQQSLKSHGLTSNACNHSTSSEDDGASTGSSLNQLSSSVGTGTGGADSGGSGNSPNAYNRRVRKFVQVETRRVHIVRFMIIGSIMLFGAAVSIGTYTFLHNKDAEEHQGHFTIVAFMVNTAFQFKVNSLFKAHRELSRSVTVASQVQSASWPLVWDRSFETHAHETRNHGAGAVELVMYAPLVTNLTEWIDFTTNDSLRWYEQSKSLFDQFEPGQERSSEPARTYLKPAVWKVSPNSSTGSMSSLEPYDVDGSEGMQYAPRFMTSPPPPKDALPLIQNEDFFSVEHYRLLANASMIVGDLVFSEFSPALLPWIKDTLYHDGNEFASSHTLAAIPVYEKIGSSVVVGYIYAVICWEKLLSNLVPKDSEGINAILKDSCGSSASFELTGDEARFIGREGVDMTGFEHDVITFDLAQNYENPKLAQTTDGHCEISLHVYHTETYEESYKSDLPVILAIVIASLFGIVALVFFLYDFLVKRRDIKVDNAAARSEAIVSSLFPSNVRDRLLAEQEQSSAGNPNDTNKARKGTHKVSVTGFLNGEAQDTEMLDSDLFKTKPIADLYPETTIMFGDIAGFTAWSSVREPAQVFTLLETLFRAFDEIANRRRVFKVETVGDCYVAVSGLPEARKDHAVVMVRFARDCMYKMWSLTSKLEVMLGPETAELAMRVGLHSGPVTAGVLRGERARFQLFGDTMNTAARMESNGRRDRIHISQETADLLVASGKSSWVSQREDKIIAKGKGELQTFWVTHSDRSGMFSEGIRDDGSRHTDVDPSSSGSVAGATGIEMMETKTLRLIDWNFEVLHRLLQKIAAKREWEGRRAQRLDNEIIGPESGQTILDEVKEIITLPQSRGMDDAWNTKSVHIPPAVLQQLKELVTVIASMYRENPFHNFEHASHVTMSVSKLLSRIAAPSDHDFDNADQDTFSLHDHTYGITSDPLTQFACIFSALVHDMDHPGVPNAQLVKENSGLATLYNNKSAAEQHSVDLAWQILMHDNYSDLRSAIYCDETEMRRFRQLVVNSVMATDIVDKELKALRNSRWEKAFATEKCDENVHDTVNRKATIVIEHLIQASDVAHTMQHWHIYRKFNCHFFMECYAAYREGRAEVDPSINWYKGELGFFDFYIIPLAKKLKECGVFGVSSDEYLNYALKNRQEWEVRGQEALDEMIEVANKRYNS